jgi:hypothetical protein
MVLARQWDISGVPAVELDDIIVPDTYAGDLQDGTLINASFPLPFFKPYVIIGPTNEDADRPWQNWETCIGLTVQMYRLRVLRDVLVDGQSLPYSLEGVRLAEGNQCHGEFGRPSGGREGRRVFDLVIGFTHAHMGWVSHALLDAFENAMLLPRWALEQGYAPIPDIGVRSWTYEAFALVGIPPERVIRVGDGDWIFAKLYLSVFPRSHIHQDPLAMFRLRAHIYHRLQLELVRPRRQLCYNRRKEEGRSFRNFNEIVEAFRAAVPTLIFEAWNDSRLCPETIRFYAECRLIFAVQGSHLANILFMKLGTVYVEVETDISCHSTQAVTRSLGILLVSHRCYEIKHWVRPAEHDFPVEMALAMLRAGLELLASDADGAREST